MTDHEHIIMDSNAECDILETVVSDCLSSPDSKSTRVHIKTAIIIIACVAVVSLLFSAIWIYSMNRKIANDLASDSFGISGENTTQPTPSSRHTDIVEPELSSIGVPGLPVMPQYSITATPTITMPRHSFQESATTMNLRPIPELFLEDLSLNVTENQERRDRNK